jgi:5'-methylthioadenosine phosphorylase
LIESGRAAGASALILYNLRFAKLRSLRGGDLSRAEIGIIGGSGLYAMPGLSEVEEVRQPTPFGDPSDAYVLGMLEGRKVAFLARHGRAHSILPSELNFRANIHGFKQLGVERMVSLSAVGSLKEEHKPLEFLIPDQFFDRTRHRVDTFFGDGIVAHVALAEPICRALAKTVEAACKRAGVVGKRGGTYLCMEGPQFSTKAESNLYRSWGMDVVGMTNLQEAKLAREAEICYVTVAMVTDYDCWHPHHDSVTVDQIVAVLRQNAENACRVVRETIAALPPSRSCECHRALTHAIVTEYDKVPPATRTKLKLILARYLETKTKQ